MLKEWIEKYLLLLTFGLKLNSLKHLREQNEIVQMSMELEM